MKKIFISITALVMSVGMLAACGANKTAEKKDNAQPTATEAATEAVTEAAEANSVSGTYTVTEMTQGDKVEKLADHPEVSMVLNFFEDGTVKYNLTSDGDTETSDGTWELDGSSITVTIDGDATPGTVDGDTIVLTKDNMTMTLVKD